ncbi:MAG: cysteine desulfurase/selenocysteine lyase [Chlamydiales bacterium]|jgi:cysteine desulfurase/selenocysteine lyase
MEINIDSVRQETPGCLNVLHFNNAGASLAPSLVLNAVKNYLDLEAEFGAYEVEEREKIALDNVYSSAATLLGCHPDEIAITENASRAWSFAFSSIPFQSGDKILTSLSEYSSNYMMMLHFAKKTGVKIEIIPNDLNGEICLSSLRDSIDDQVKLISLTHIPTNNGLINPAEAVGKIAKKNNILFLLDATQSIGQIPLDVKNLRCDILCGTGRKFLRGPRGTGLLYVRKELIPKLEPLFPDLRSANWLERDEFSFRHDAKCFESWECNFASKIGLGVAIDYALSLGIENIESRIISLANNLRKNLKDIPRVTVHDFGKRKCGIITFSINDQDSSLIQQSLLKQKINVSISSLESTRLNMAPLSLNKILRASLHYYNTEAEIEKFCKALSSISRSLQLQKT